MPALCQPAQQNASRLELGQEKALTCHVCHHFDELVLTGAQRGEPRAPLRQGRPVLQGDPAEDMPWPVGQAEEHLRCGGSRYRSAGTRYAHKSHSHCRVSLSTQQNQFRRINAEASPSTHVT